MDMSMQFRSVIKTIFKGAHRGRPFSYDPLSQWAMERVRKAEQKRLCHHSRMFKSNKTILTKPYEKLTEEDFISWRSFSCSPRLKMCLRAKYVLTCNGVQEFLAVYFYFFRKARHAVKITCHGATFNGIDSGFSRASAYVWSSGRPSSSPRFLRAPDQAKIVATGFVEVFSPLRYL